MKNNSNNSLCIDYNKVLNCIQNDFNIFSKLENMLCLRKGPKKLLIV